MKRTSSWLAVVLGLGAAAPRGAPPAAPTFQELMDPARFPDPQRGMVVESAARTPTGIRVVTSGAEITLDPRSGEIRFGQRIGRRRELAVLRTGQPWEGVELTHTGAGFARIVVARPRLTVRINGDSLFMLHARDRLTATVTRAIEPAWCGSSSVGHLLADEWGAFGLYASNRRSLARFDPYAETVATCPLPADSVLWLGVCPPKPYPWERSLSDTVVWHWSRQLGYPSDEILRSWKPHGNVVLLQSEVMLWKDWNLDFVPRAGAAEFARVRRTLHDLGMRFIVYTSPYYFLKGTSLENRAMNSFEDFKGWPPGTSTGENMGVFMPAVRRVMAEHKPDGLYFDGQYISNPAALYALARGSRDVVGEDGILEWHSTTALAGGMCYLPQADAYVDFILRGEGRKSLYDNFDYLRFFVSGYNISNSIGVLCNNGATGITSEMVRNVLRANGRFHVLVSWLQRPDFMRVVNQEYKAALTPGLRTRVDREVDARQARVARRAKARRREQLALGQAPSRGKPFREITFDRLPDGKQVVSELNPSPFAVVAGRLRIRARAHTYAYLSVPLGARVSGFAIKLRHGTDGGMSWGPGAALRWAGGQLVRLGTRGDRMLQADILGRQYHGYSFDPNEWTWLRVRWLETIGVVEHSTDGVAFEPLWTFEHGGVLNDKTVELLVGKVPYDGQPEDHSVPGETGECEIDSVRIYGMP